MNKKNNDRQKFELYNMKIKVQKIKKDVSWRYILKETPPPRLAIQVFVNIKREKIKTKKMGREYKIQRKGKIWVTIKIMYDKSKYMTKIWIHQISGHKLVEKARWRFPPSRTLLKIWLYVHVSMSL